MQSTPDKVLIGRIANGDRLAMQVLYARYHVRVFRFVVRLVRDEATGGGRDQRGISRRVASGWPLRGALDGIDMVAGDCALQGHIGAQTSTGRGVGRRGSSRDRRSVGQSRRRAGEEG